MKSYMLAGLVSAFALCACSPEQGADGETQTVETGSAAQRAEARTFTVLVDGTPIGSMQVEPAEAGFEVDFEYRNNGRGPTLAETVTLDEQGYPVSWAIEGAETFGNTVDESYECTGDRARWSDSTGEGEADAAEPVFYVPQNSTPYFLALAGRALIADEDRTITALPGGELRLTEMENVTVSGPDGESRELTAYALSGTSLDPTYFLMEGTAFFGMVTPGFSILEEGYDGEDERLRALASRFGSERYAEITARVAHDFDAPVRIANVRIFDARTGRLGDPASVLVEDNRIAAIEGPDAAQDGEVVIDGAGGTLVPGLFEMHAHLGDTSAMLGVAAGTTSVRDMGNNNEVLSELIGHIEAGEMAGPRVFRAGFIEGRSPYNSNNGIVVETEAEAVAAVNTYADNGFAMIKIYNSMQPDWIPAVIEAAHARDMHVMGHVPAFTDADAMIEAGYDELTHINQLMLGWVLEEGEDTRTLLRLTALKRLPELDLRSEAVQSTLDAIVENDIAIDPTFAIHEALLLSRNGELSPGAADYIDHMPADIQRSARSAWADIATPEDDAAYRGAFETITEALALMRERGIEMVPGTDLGGSFAYHRELELYQSIGMSPAEIVSWASLGMAEYLGVGDELGTIEEGKLADFFLVPGNPAEDFKAIKTISMVMADGTVYYPAEIYPEFGIVPFAEMPQVTLP